MLDLAQGEKILGLRGLILGLIGVIMGLRRLIQALKWLDLIFGRGGGMYGRTYGQTDVWKFTPVSYRTSALWGRCPKRKKENQDPEVDQHTRYGIAFLLQIVVLLRGPELASYFKESMENMARCCIKI